MLNLHPLHYLLRADPDTRNGRTAPSKPYVLAGMDPVATSAKLARVLHRLLEGGAAACGRTVLFWADRLTNPATVSACLPLLLTLLKVCPYAISILGDNG